MPAQIFYCLSEWNTHENFTQTGISKASGVPQVILEVVFVVHKHAAYLPRLHSQQATHRDTALLMVSKSPDPRFRLAPGAQVNFKLGRVPNLACNGRFQAC